MTLILNGTDGLSDVDGTAATPAIRGTDTNTGIFFPAADTIAFSEGGVESMRIDSAGNVGIGTSSPNANAKLTLTDGTGAAQYFNSTGAGGDAAYIALQKSVDGLTFGCENRGFVWKTGSATVLGGTERMRISAGGNLLVNATSQTFGEKFKVVNSGAGNNAAFFWFDDATNDRGAILVKNTRASGGTSGSMVAFLNSSDSAVGAITSTGSATTYSTSSDYRLKENIAPMTGALGVVQQLKPVTYNWKVDGSSGQGFIAHELQAVVPDCVTGEKDALNEDGSIKAQGIDTSFLVATLTAAIQELKIELDSVKAELATLKGAA